MKSWTIKNLFVYLLSILTLVGFLFTMMANVQAHELTLSNKVYDNEEEVFYPHDDSIAMTVNYAPVLDLRTQLETILNAKLDFFKGYNTDGEAHVTVITPPEYMVLKTKLSIHELIAIAQKYEIQKSRLMVQGIGSGKVGTDETFFVIVDSYQLRMIRQQMFYEFTRRGGDRKAFDPTWFFPHITIGFTKRDFHESDGVLKNLKFSADKRFNLQTR